MTVRSAAKVVLGAALFSLAVHALLLWAAAIGLLVWIATNP